MRAGDGRARNTGVNQPVDVHQIVLGAARAVAGGSDAGSAILHLTSSAGDLWGDAEEVEALLVALVLHVRAGLENSACLHVRAYDVPADERGAPGERGTAAEAYVAIEVSTWRADGTVHELERCQGPKRIAMGRPLRRVLGSHGARVECFRGAKGCVARLSLPRRRPPPSTRRRETEVTVLIADDDAALRDAAADALREMGHLVFTASDGEEALAIFSASHREIDAVILDVQMPRLEGGSCLVRLRDIDPGLVVLLVSGAPLPLELQGAVRAGDARFFSKPYDIDHLANALVERSWTRPVRLVGGSGR